MSRAVLGYLATGFQWVLWIACVLLVIPMILSIPGDPGLWDFLAYIGTVIIVTHYPILLPVFVIGGRIARKDGDARRARILHKATMVIVAVTGCVVATIAARDCQEFCAGGHDDGKERTIAWRSTKSFWTSFWRDATRRRFSPVTG